MRTPSPRPSLHRLPSVLLALAALAAPGSAQQRGEAPSAEELVRNAPRASPFRAMRDAGGALEVQVDDEMWYRLEQIGKVRADDLVARAKQEFASRWWKRVSEDLPGLLALMGDDPSPHLTADLVLRPLGGGEPIRMAKVPMTETKRRALWEANKERDEPAETRPPAALDDERIDADLAALRALLDTKFAYRHLREVDLDAELRATRERLGDGPVAVTRFAREIDRVLAVFGDGHAGVEGEVLAGRAYLPFLLADAAGGAVAFAADRTRLVDPAHPFVVALDGRPLADWLDAAAANVAHGSPQLRRARALRNLRFADTLRADLGLQNAAELRVTLADARGDRVERAVPLASDKPIYGTWPRTEHAVLPGEIGYLRLASMNDEPAFLAALGAAMQRFRKTRGLIVDVRGNGGGSRAPLLHLFPYFLRKGDAPRVASIAAARLDPGDDPQRAEGWLANRFMWPLQWDGWSDDARAAIAVARDGFRPEWDLPAGAFSDWHYLVLEAKANPDAYRYERPVVVLLDEGCFSATDVFLGAFAGWRDVTLLGTASGGGSARRQAHVLPRSGLRVSLASMASFRPNGQLYDGRGVAPDVVVERAPQDLVSAGDAQLDAALARLRR